MGWRVSFDLITDLLENRRRALSGKSTGRHDVAVVHPKPLDRCQGIKQRLPILLEVWVFRLSEVQIVTELFESL